MTWSPFSEGLLGRLSATSIPPFARPMAWLLYENWPCPGYTSRVTLNTGGAARTKLFSMSVALAKVLN
jgi:hypothetical protein